MNHTHTHLTALCLGPRGWTGTKKVKTNLDFTEARDSEWQWHQLGHIQVCTSLQTDNHASTPPLIFLQAGFPSCHPTNSVKALKATDIRQCWKILFWALLNLCVNCIDNAVEKFYSERCWISVWTVLTTQSIQSLRGQHYPPKTLGPQNSEP